MTRNYAVNMLDNSNLDERHIMNRNFGADKTPIEVIKDGTLGRTYFGDIYSGVNSKWHKTLWKKFDELKNIDQRYYSSNYYDVSVNKYGVKCELH